MKISSIHTKELSLLESAMRGTDRETRTYLRNMHENFVVPYNNYLNNISRRLTEAELTPDQITKLFGSVAQGAQAAGGNETMLGKLMPDSIKQKFSDSLPPADAGEVPGFEQKAQAAVQQIQDPATKQSLMQLIKQGLQNPTTQKLIISGVQGIAGVAAGALTGGLGGKLGATAAGAITGGLVGLVAAKLQGQDWKSAAKAGLKGAAVGGAGGLVGSLASGAASSAMDAMSGGQNTGDLPGASLSVGQKLPDGEVISSLDSMNPNSSVTITRPDGSTYSVSHDTALSMTGQQGITNLPRGPVSMGATGDVDAGVRDNTGSGAGSSEFAATDPRRVDQQTGAGAGRGSVNPATVTPGQPTAPDTAPDTSSQQAEPSAVQATSTSNQGRLKMNQWRQDVGSPNAVPTTPDTTSDGSYQQAAPLGRDGQPMQQVPMDEPADSAPTTNQGRLKMNQWRQDVGSPNAVTPSTPSDGSYQQAAPLGSDGQPMQQVPMDEPAGGGLDNIKSGLAAPTGADGKPMKEVPMDEPAGGGEISADGKPYPEGLTATQKQIYDNPIQVGSDNKGTVSFTDGNKLDAVFVPPGGMQPRFPVGAQKMDFPFDGKMVTGYIVGDKVWFPNFAPGAKSESRILKARALKEYIDKDTTIFMWALNESTGKPRGGIHLTEAGIGDVIGNIGSWLKTKGQNLTQNVTADKLTQAWTKAGKPTDSEKVAELLKQQGVDPAIISSTYQSMGIPANGGSAQTPSAQPAAQQTAGQPAQPATQPAAQQTAGQPAQPATQPAAQQTAGQPAQPATQPAAQQTAGQPAASQPSGGGAGIFADPQQLAASFQSFLDAGGTVPPRMRGVLKDILLTALRTVESRQRKINKIVKEGKRIERQLIALKKQKPRL